MTYCDYYYFCMICHNFHKKEQNRVLLVIMSSNDSMPKYCGCEADGCHRIGSYMNKYYCESFLSIDLNKVIMISKKKAWKIFSLKGIHASMIQIILIYSKLTIQS